eukprot:9537645-Prorocentrum_lima.AAC.1
MTSSLVGSEMCIRDSSFLLRPLCPCKGPRAPCCSYRAGRRIFWQEAPLIAVSYTHLTLPTICSV